VTTGYPDMRKSLQRAFMLTATAAIATSFTLTTPCVWAAEGDSAARGITTNQEHGRKIYVNDDGPERPRLAAAPQAKKSTLAYWSSKENRWKPVPGANTASMQQLVNTSAVALSVVTAPIQPTIGSTVVLKAAVTGVGLTNKVVFNENGTVLPGCGAVAVALLRLCL